MGFALGMGLRFTDRRLLGIGATVLFSQLSISTLNDWADRERDALTDRGRPIPLGLIHPRVALSLATVFGICTLVGSLPFGLLATSVLLVGLGAGWSYDLWLKPTRFSFVPFAIAFPLLPTWVGVVLGRPFSAFSWLVAAGAWLGVAIHVADSLPDLEADAQAGVRSLAVVLGTSGSIMAIVVCMVVAAVVAAVALQSSPLPAALLLLAAAGASVLVISIGPSRPASVRWMAAAFGIGTALALLPSITHA